MASRVTQGQMIIQNENFNVHHIKTVAGGKTMSSKATIKKDGVVGSRKALNDITNKSGLHHKTGFVSRKQNLPNEEFNIAEEMFLHDHRKCIEGQQNARNLFYLDMVLPGQDSMSNDEYLESKEEKTHVENTRCYDEPVELPMSEFSDWMLSSAQWHSPPCSPMRWDSPPIPLGGQFETVEFMLK